MFNLSVENSFELTEIEFDYLKNKLKLGRFPVIVGRMNLYKTVDEQKEFFENAELTLTKKNLLSLDKEIDETLVKLVNSFSFAQRSIEIRFNLIGREMIRLFIGRRGGQNIIFAKDSEKIYISDVWTDGAGRSFAKILLSMLNEYTKVKPMPELLFNSISLRSEVFTRIFSNISSQDNIITGLYSAGAELDDANKVGVAFGKLFGYTEIVFSSHEEGINRKVDKAISIFETYDGRVVIYPSNDDWLVISPGNENQIGNGFENLVNNFSIHGWY